MSPATRVVTVFGSAKTGEKDPQYRAAEDMGRRLAQKGFVICNGGYGGIMEASARGAKQGGGRTLGITTEQFPGQVNDWIDREEKVPTWRERLFRLIEKGDAYVVFDGGTGTLTELFITWEMTNKKMMQKPVILFGDEIREMVTALKDNRWVQFNAFLKNARTTEEVLLHLAP